MKDPSGEKKMTMKDFYNDHTCVEEIHEGFVSVYIQANYFGQSSSRHLTASLAGAL